MIANKAALRVDIRPLTRGRLRVRLIIASHFGSYSILKAFALAAHNDVPVVRKRSVSVEREGVSVAEGLRTSGTGYRE
jgi:hypothetical protein